VQPQVETETIEERYAEKDPKLAVYQQEQSEKCQIAGAQTIAFAAFR